MTTCDNLLIVIAGGCDCTSEAMRTDSRQTYSVKIEVCPSKARLSTHRTPRLLLPSHVRITWHRVSHVRAATVLSTHREDAGYIDLLVQIETYILAMSVDLPNARPPANLCEVVAGVDKGEEVLHLYLLPGTRLAEQMEFLEMRPPRGTVLHQCADVDRREMHHHLS